MYAKRQIKMAGKTEKDVISKPKSKAGKSAEEFAMDLVYCYI